MDASAAHARVAIGLLIAAALAVPAAPARAQESETPAPVETAPLPQEAALEVEEALDRAQTQIDEAIALGLAHPPPATPQPAAGQEPVAVEEGRVAEPEPAVQVQAEAGVEVAPEPAVEVALQPTTAPPQPSGLQEDSPARAPDPLAPAGPNSDLKPEPAVEPERRAHRHASDGDARMVRRLDARLRVVERGLRRVRAYVDAGAAPPPRLLVQLRRGVQRLLPAIAVLERHAAQGLGSVPGLDLISERLESARGAAAALVAAFQRRAAERTPQTDALIEQLVALQHALPTRTPADRARRRTTQTLLAHRRPTASHSRVVAYTQAHAGPTQAQSGNTAATEGAAARTQKLPEGPRPWPAPPATPSSGAAVGPSGSFFTFAGPAALALLLGLAIPRVLRRLARLPAGRQPESFWSPPERPG